MHPVRFSWFDFYTRNRFRYRYDQEINDYIDDVVRNAASRTVIYSAGTSLWRAQRGCKERMEEIPVEGSTVVWKDNVDGCGRPYKCLPFHAERMKPELEKAREGRINSKGIPCLYLATHEDTAMSEVRPWHAARISLARLTN